MVVVGKGPGNDKDDIMFGQMFIASEHRWMLENMQESRRTDGDSKVLPVDVIEKKLGSVLIASGTIVALFDAELAGILQRYMGLVKLDPETYYVDVVPIELNIPLIIILNVATLVVSVLVLIAPSYLISHIQPAKCSLFAT